MKNEKLLEKLNNIKNSINSREYNVAKLRVNLLMASILSELEYEIICDNCSAVKPDLCVCKKVGE